MWLCRILSTWLPCSAQGCTNRAHAQRPTPAFSNRKPAQCSANAWLSSPSIDDLRLKELARVGRAVLTVTPTVPPPLRHVSSSLHRLCLLKAKITPEIGWDGVNVGQELLVQTRASWNSSNVPKTAVSSQEALKGPPVAGRHTEN